MRAFGSVRSNFAQAVGGLRGILAFVRSRASRMTGALVLLTCLICPLIEMFDTWDHTIQTGNDTEYALVVLALCVGATYSFARFIFKCLLLRFVARNVFNSSADRPLRPAPFCSTPLLFSVISPHLLPLRIYKSTTAYPQ